MTVKELLKLTPDSQTIYFENTTGCITELNRCNPIEVAAYGEFLILTLEARDENKLEICFILEPKREV